MTIRFLYRPQNSSGFLENLEIPQAPFLQAILDGRPKHAEAIFETAAEIDGGSIGEIFRGACHLRNFIAGIEDLCQHLVVKDKVVGVVVVVDITQHLSRKGPITRMILRKFLVHQDILEERQAAVEEILIEGHAAFARAHAQDARPQHNGIDAIDNDVAHRLYEFWSVLIVRMQHHHHVGAEFEGFVVAGFLVAAIAFVGLMPDNVPYAQVLCDLDSLVGRVVVNQNHLVHDVTRNLIVCLLQRPCRVIGREHHAYLTVFQHIELSKKKVYKITKIFDFLINFAS